MCVSEVDGCWCHVINSTVGLEKLPCDILMDIFRRQTDMKSIVSFAMSSKHIHDVLKRSRLFRLLHLPNTGAKQAVNPENQQVVRSLQADEHLCTVCWMCMTIFMAHCCEP